MQPMVRRKQAELSIQESAELSIQVSAELSIQVSARTADLTTGEAGQLIVFLLRLAKLETYEALALKGLDKFM